MRMTARVFQVKDEAFTSNLSYAFLRFQYPSVTHVHEGVQLQFWNVLFSLALPSFSIRMWGSEFDNHNTGGEATDGFLRVGDWDTLRKELKCVPEDGTWPIFASRKFERYDGTNFDVAMMTSIGNESSVELVVEMLRQIRCEMSLDGKRRILLDSVRALPCNSIIYIVPSAVLLACGAFEYNVKRMMFSAELEGPVMLDLKWGWYKIVFTLRAIIERYR